MILQPLLYMFSRSLLMPDVMPKFQPSLGYGLVAVWCPRSRCGKGAPALAARPGRPCHIVFYSRKLEGQAPRKARFARGLRFSPPSALTAPLPAAWRFPSRQRNIIRLTGRAIDGMARLPRNTRLPQQQATKNQNRPTQRKPTSHRVASLPKPYCSSRL